MNSNEIDNDTRGWIMCVTSGIACIIGSSIICVDVLVRCIPSKRNWRIEESTAFLASSLSLSFGVMLFSALYSMLPSSKKYLILSDFTPANAAWILMGCFTAGFAGIQIVSRFVHQHIPSHVVDCDHSHKEEAITQEHGRPNSQSGHGHGHLHSHGEPNGKPTESSPLLPQQDQENGKHFVTSNSSDLPIESSPLTRSTTEPSRRSSMFEVQQEVQKRVLSFMKDTKPNCDSSGPCYGYTDPCGQECYKHIATRSRGGSKHLHLRRTATGHFSIGDEEAGSFGQGRQLSSPTRITRVRSREPLIEEGSEESDSALSSDQSQDQHHHHVPENAFLSIGLQTSIAIALHKVPEGFITFATNHANPSLGFSVFMALFIHNITEGFALALPLYLAIKSRGWAMFWSSLLGGVSQPLGAGVAALWFKLAGHENHEPGTAVYGCMFAITAGIMTSVALQLFVESLSMNHNRNLCIAFAFIGMLIMALSNALTSY